MAVYIDKEDTLEETLDKINREIESRRSYGTRVEELTTTKKATTLNWSNGNASWYAGRIQEEVKCSAKLPEIQSLANFWADLANAYPKECKFDIENMSKSRGALREMEDKGTIECRHLPSKAQCLDANQIVVVGVPRKVLDSIASLLDQLPLYSGSFEARERGEFSLKGVEIPPGLKAAWAQSMITGKPLDVQSEIALSEKFEAEG